MTVQVISKVNALRVTGDTSIKEAMKQLDKTGKKVLLVVDEKSQLLGTLSDGDIRRAILDGKNFEASIDNCYNRDPKFIFEKEFEMGAAKAILLANGIDIIPVINAAKEVVNYVSISQVLSAEQKSEMQRPKIDIPVIIMAGGKGTRLDPLTRIIPKPLIPIGEKTMLERIIDQFWRQGCRSFYLTLNYKGDIIRSYFDALDKAYQLTCVEEGDYLGTAGSLKMFEGKFKTPFVVSNCDVFLDTSFADVKNFHQEKGSMLTLLSSFQHYKIPYGVVDFIKGGQVTKIVEKPEYSHFVNTGIYILNPETLDYIPDNTRFDMTDLIEALIKDKRPVFTYPINENDYAETG